MSQKIFSEFLSNFLGMSLPFVGPDRRGFYLVQVIQFQSTRPKAEYLGNCIMSTKENPRPPGPTNGNDIPKKLLKNPNFKLNIRFFHFFFYYE